MTTACVGGYFPLVLSATAGEYSIVELPYTETLCVNLAEGAGGGGGGVGATGFTGFTGFTGTTGPTGSSTGYTGFTGFTGFTGQTGGSGRTGFTGKTGFTGETGASGRTGFTGFTGETGGTGATGFTGFTGFTGETGGSGRTGFTGFTGFTGETGGSGRTGYTGFTGKTGFTGQTGGTGFTGETGVGDVIGNDTWGETAGDGAPTGFFRVSGPDPGNGVSKTVRWINNDGDRPYFSMANSNFTRAPDSEDLPGFSLNTEFLMEDDDGEPGATAVERFDMTVALIATGATGSIFATKVQKANGTYAAIPNVLLTDLDSVGTGDLSLSGTVVVRNLHAANSLSAGPEADVQFDTSPSAPAAWFSGTGDTVKLNNMTDTQRDALTGATGMVLYNDTSGRLEVHNGTDWELAGAHTALNSYNFNAFTVSPAGGGELRLNNATQGDATKIFISESNANLQDQTRLLKNVQDGDTIRIQSDFTEDAWGVYVVSAAVVDNGTWRSISVNTFDNGPTDFVDGESVTVSYDTLTWIDESTHLLVDGTRPLTANWGAGSYQASDLGTVMVQATAPTTPAIGQLWLDTSTATTETDGLPYTTQTTTYTILSSDSVVYCNGTFTATLPSAVGLGGKVLWVKNIGTGIVTLDADGTETVDESLSATIGAKEALTVSSDGVEWWIL